MYLHSASMSTGVYNSRLDMSTNARVVLQQQILEENLLFREKITTLERIMAELKQEIKVCFLVDHPPLTYATLSVFFRTKKTPTKSFWNP